MEKLTKEEFEYLSKYEDRLKTAVGSNFVRAIPSGVVHKMREIYSRLIGKTYSMNENCGGCILTLCKKLNTPYNEYKETIANLKKNIEDIKNEKINLIKEQINNLEDKKRKIEEEIEKLNKTLDYKKDENENIAKPENNLIKEEIPKNITFNDLIDNLKNEQGKSVKLERIVKKTDTIEQMLNSDMDNIQNKDYIFYNLNIIDDKKDIIISNGDEYKVFKIENK